MPTFYNYVVSMEDQTDKQDKNICQAIENMPNEILLNLIKKVIAAHLNCIISCDDIFKTGHFNEEIGNSIINIFLTNSRFQELTFFKEDIIRDAKKLKLEKIKDLANNHSRTGITHQFSLKLLLDDNIKNTSDLSYTITYNSTISKSCLQKAITFIINGCNINTKNFKDETTLLLAAKNGHTNLVKILILLDADLNEHDVVGETPLMHAASNGYLDIVKLLINAGADIDAVCDNKDKYHSYPGYNDGRTALMHAICNNHKDIAKLLIGLGADLNLKDKFENTALTLLNQKGLAYNLI